MPKGDLCFRDEPGDRNDEDNNTFLIVKGRYKGTDGYYRLDIADRETGQYLPLLRNHTYDFYIHSVNIVGFPSMKEAIDYGPANIDAGLVVVNDSREMYRDILVSPIAKDGQLNINIVSDRLKETTGTLDIRTIKFDGTEVNRIKNIIKVPSNTSTVLYSTDISSLVKGIPVNEVLVYATFTDNTGQEYANRYFLALQKDIDFPKVAISKSIKAITDGYEVTLKADNFARGVMMSIDGIENFFENNYFDLLPEEDLTVKVRTSISQEGFERQLKITSFVDYI